MLNSVDFSGKPFHFIGVGGIGMSALAYILTKRKLPVSGSDIRLNHITQRLQELGAHIFLSQDASNLEYFQKNARLETAATLEKSTELVGIVGGHGGTCTADPHTLPQVVCSTAISTGNAEYKAALDLGCPVFHRSDLLAALVQASRGIAVAGTHGKTTTSSLIGYMLLKAGLDPTIVVGGEVSAWEGNARLGESSLLVAEADESDGSLVKFRSEIGVVTNIELDHPDHYSTLDEVIETFQTFNRQCETLVGCWDCTVVRDRLKPAISYSLDRDSGADYAVDQVSYRADGTTAQVWERGIALGTLKLQLLGRHNLSNALAAVAVGRLLGLDFAAIASAIATFDGARRRFELRGEVNNIRFVDDYAHHPSEIQATLAAAHLQVSDRPDRRLIAVFQPHRYSRTVTFLDEFAQSFSAADVVITTDIYSAGEIKEVDISGEQVAEAIAQHHSCVHYQASLADVRTFLTQTLQPGDLVVFLGAGNLNQVIPDVVASLQMPPEQVSVKPNHIADS